MFSIFLTCLALGLGLVWLLDHFYFAPKRRATAAAALGVSVNELQQEPELPYIVDTAHQIFPIIAFIVVLRSFLYEPFQIPSGSMMPTLLEGDFILVEKYTYGLRDPIVRSKFYDIGAPERGDILVFKYPPDTRLDYIKRVVGLPGDRIFYRQKQLTIVPACPSGDNCASPFTVGLSEVENSAFSQNRVPLKQFTEQLDDTPHDILQHPIYSASPAQFYRQPGTALDEWVVPAGEYFVLGDNRDNSRDSRFWGFVKEEHLVGKAVAIWMSFDFDRAESDFIPTWVPSGVRFERIGGIQ